VTGALSFFFSCGRSVLLDGWWSCSCRSAPKSARRRPLSSSPIPVGGSKMAMLWGSEGEALILSDSAVWGGVASRWAAPASRNHAIGQLMRPSLTPTMTAAKRRRSISAHAQRHRHVRCIRAAASSHPHAVASQQDVDPRLVCSTSEEWQRSHARRRWPSSKRALAQRHARCMRRAAPTVGSGVRSGLRRWVMGRRRSGEGLWADFGDRSPDFRTGRRSGTMGPRSFGILRRSVREKGECR
jgi:hypothetical protein